MTPWDCIWPWYSMATSRPPTKGHPNQATTEEATEAAMQDTTEDTPEATLEASAVALWTKRHHMMHWRCGLRCRTPPDPPWQGTFEAHSKVTAVEELSGEKATVARLLDLLNTAMQRELEASTTNAHACEIPPRGASGARALNCGSQRSLFREIKSFIIQIL